ncbi:MAG TPA: hypothetical protein VLZ72_07020 [Flavobacterium sp.]|nr:hypothetical protein [Flavobacterium sp.]
MHRSKIIKISSFLLVTIILAGTIWYYQLSNRHKAIVKTKILHTFGLVNNQWEVESNIKKYTAYSPTFLVDNIYKSMEGPKASNYVMLSQDSSLVWITGFSVEALDSKTNSQISNDFICHMNVDLNEVKYYTHFGLEDRIHKQYPRLTSLSHGMESFRFPEGYGVPMKGNDVLFVTTQTLNHNQKDIFKKVKHKISIDYDTKNLKPLMSRITYIMLPFNKKDPYKEPSSPGEDFCIPVETKNHTYTDEKGNMLSGHWIIPIGKNTYKSNINEQLQIKDSLCLHAAAIHVHPFAEKIRLWDKTSGQDILVSHITNHKDRIGLGKIEDFISEKGVWLYAHHDYEIILDVNNASDVNQDMMGSMFLFFYDKEMDQIIQSKNPL